MSEDEGIRRIHRVCMIDGGKGQERGNGYGGSVIVISSNKLWKSI